MDFDYTTLYTTFSKVLSQKFNLTMIESNGNGEQPPSPFVVFDIISPYIPINWEEDDNSNAFEAVVSFTVFEKSKIASLNLATKIRSSLTDSKLLSEFNSNDILIVEKMPINIRYVPEPIITTYMTGFDIRLRLTNNHIDSVENIETANTKKVD